MERGFDKGGIERLGGDLFSVLKRIFFSGSSCAGSVPKQEIISGTSLISISREESTSLHRPDFRRAIFSGEASVSIKRHSRRQRARTSLCWDRCAVSQVKAIWALPSMLSLWKEEVAWMGA